jgi:putative transposase
VVKAFRYRLYPTRAQDAALRSTLERLRRLYNAALEERREAYRKQGVSVTRAQQEKALTEIKRAEADYADDHTHLLQDVTTRLDRAFQAFFRRCKAGENPGYPRFKGRGRYHTFTFKDAAHGNGAKVVAGGQRVQLAGIGKVKFKLHRPLRGRLKTVSITLDSDGHWYAVFTCDRVPAELLPPTGAETGLDVGIASFATLADGETIDNPRPLEHAQQKLTKAQRRRARKRAGSNRRRKAARLEAKHHARVRNARKDFHHKTARALVRRFDRIVVEDLNVKGLAGGMLARPVHDAGWAQFLTILACKAESAGRDNPRVNPAGTSQTCSGCWAHVPKDLSVRVHQCPHCGLVLDRDANAARNLLRLGRSLRREGAWVPSTTREAPASA